MKYMPIPILTPWYVYKSSHESVFYNDICKNFNTGIYRPTSLHVLSRLPSPRVGIHGVAIKDGEILGFNLYCYINLNLTFRKRGVGFSGKRQNDVIKDKIDL